MLDPGTEFSGTFCWAVDGAACPFIADELFPSEGGGVLPAEFTSLLFPHADSINAAKNTNHNFFIVFSFLFIYPLSGLTGCKNHFNASRKFLLWRGYLNRRAEGNTVHANGKNLSAIICSEVS